MPAGTPQAAHSSKVRFEVGGTPRTLYATEWEEDESAEELDFSNFESGGYRTRIPGLKNLRMTISGWVDVGANPHDTPLFLNSGQTLTNVGAYYSGTAGPLWLMPSALVVNVRETARVDDMVRYTATLLSKGTYTLPTGNL